jgi:hypothetical protein
MRSSSSPLFRLSRLALDDSDGDRWLGCKPPDRLMDEVDVEQVATGTGGSVQDERFEDFLAGSHIGMEYQPGTFDNLAPSS